MEQPVYLINQSILLTLILGSLINKSCNLSNKHLEKISCTDNGEKKKKAVQDKYSQGLLMNIYIFNLPYILY